MADFGISSMESLASATREVVRWAERRPRGRPRCWWLDQMTKLREEERNGERFGLTNYG
jgi:hypothetical protein